MKKRLMALLLAVAMMGSMVPVTAFAAVSAGTAPAQAAPAPAEEQAEADLTEATAAPSAEPAASEEPASTPETAAPAGEEAPSAAPDALPTAEPTPETDETPAPSATPEAAETPEPTETPAPDAAEESDTAAMLALADEPVPLEEPASVKVKYREKDLPYYELNGDTIAKGSNLMYIILPAEMKDQWDQWLTYTYAVTAPGDGSVTTIQPEDLKRASKGEIVYWSYTPQKGGQYTLSVKNGAEEIAKGTVTLVAVTFHAGANFEFASGNSDTYVGYFEKPKYVADALLSRCNVPALNKKAEGNGKDFIGWSIKETPGGDVYTSQEVIRSDSLLNALVGKYPEYNVDDSHYALDVYAAYGVSAIPNFTYTDADDVEAINKDIVLGQAKAGYDPNTYAKTYQLKNIGTTDITIVPMQGPSFATIEYKTDEGKPANPGGGKFTIPVGKIYSMVITPNAGLGVGTHSGRYTLFRVDEKGWNCGNKIEFSVTTNTLLVRLKANEKVTKVYGKSMTAEDLRGKLEVVYRDTGTPYEGTTDALDALGALGVTLNSEGFKSGTDFGTYPINSLTTSTDSGITIEYSPDLKMEVTKDTPQPQSLSATAIHLGSPLSASKLTGTFVNSNDPSMAVTGTLTWAENLGFSSAAEGDVEATWIFTPDESHKKNYEQATGEVKVTVSKKETTTLIPEPTNAYTVTYDKQPHTLAYTSDRVGDETAIEIKYTDSEGNVVEQPTRAGTYNVEVHIGDSGKYAPATLTTTLTIEPKVLSSFQAQSAPSAKRYDGTTEVKHSGVGGVNITAGVEAGDEVKVTKYTEQFESPDAKQQARVKVTILELGGAAAANYKLPADPVCYTYADIYLQKLTITPKNFTKYYGEPLDLSASDFEIKDWNNNTVSGEDAGLTFASNGMPADAQVGGGKGEGGKYVIGALLGSKNYTFGSSTSNPVQTMENCGTITVQKAKPVVDGVLSVGAGRKNCELDHVTLGGGFVNDHNPDMPVTGTLEWKDKTITLPKDADTYEAAWIFKPSDTTNYEESVEGTVTIQLLDQEPVHITVEGATEVTYNGLPHGLSATLEPAESSYEVEYSHHGVGDWSKEEPVGAGTYDVRITAYPPAASEYAANQITTLLTISPAEPTSTVPGTMEVLEGTALNSEDVLKNFEKCFTFNGEAVEGSVTWAAEGGVVSEDGELFEWVFTPSSGNFKAIGDIMRFTLKDDTRKVSAEVYNLPDAQQYLDYAVVDIAASGLRAGDIVTFFKGADKDGKGTDPVSLDVPVTAEDVGNGKLTVQLNSGALAANAGGTIYARITSSRKNKAAALTYNAEPGFELVDTGGGPAESIMVHPGIKTNVTAKLLSESYQILSVTFTLSNADGIVKLVTADPNALTRELEGIAMGSGATLTVIITFQHPDPARKTETIVLTDTMAVACAGTIDAEASSEGNAPLVAPLDPEMARDALETDADRTALAAGEKINYYLHVKESEELQIEKDRPIVEKTLAQSRPDYTVGQYVDISLTRSVNNGAEVPVHDEIPKPLTITLTVPDTVMQEAKQATNWPQFAIVHVHGGKAEILPDLDNALETITIETNSFSTYAIAYRNPVGELVVSKTVTGTAGDRAKAFTFQITLEDAAITGKAYGDITFTDGKATVTLKHGESLKATGLPVGVPYTVTEAEAGKDGYTTTATGASGTIAEGTTTAAFTNHKDAPAPGGSTPAYTSPRTSDESTPGLWLALLVFSALGLAVVGCLFYRRKKKD